MAAYVPAGYVRYKKGIDIKDKKVSGLVGHCSSRLQ